MQAKYGSMPYLWGLNKIMKGFANFVFVIIRIACNCNRLHYTIPIFAPCLGVAHHLNLKLGPTLQTVVFVFLDFCMCLSLHDPLAYRQEILFVVNDVRAETL